MIVLWLSLTSAGAWFVSTLVGGGSPFILIPAIAFFLGPIAVAPVITLGMLLGNAQRVWFYWPHLNLFSFWWYLPGALFGACLGALALTKVQIEWLPLLLAVFLLTYALGYVIKGANQSFSVRPWYFLPAGFIYAFLSALLGSTGPLLNPFYLNYGLGKEELMATKSAHMVVLHLIKIIAYAAFGTLTWSYVGYGMVMAIAAIPGNWIGQIVLEKISEERFRHLAVGFIAFSALVMLWEERGFFLFW